MRIDHLDHLVLTVGDIDAAIDFYTTVLGMEEVVMARGRRGLAFGAQQINLDSPTTSVQPRPLAPTPGAADLCLILATPLADAIDELRASGVEIIAGPVSRTGAQGPITSIYIHDPDGNLIELANYGGS